MEEQSTKKPVSSALTIDRAAFLLLRVKKAFKKKKQQRKEKNALLVQTALASSGAANTRPAPLLRSRTLPAIVVPGLSILQAQLDARVANDGTLQPSSACGSRRSSGLRLTPRASLVGGGCLGGESRRGSSQRVSPRTSLAPPPDLDITADGTVVLRVPAPHVVAARAYRMSLSTGPLTPLPTPTAQAPLYRLARLLAQSPGSKGPPAQVPPEEGGVRRLSWERRDANGGGRLPRSSSIDSMVEAVWSEGGPPLDGSPPFNCKGGPALCLASPSAGRRSKGHRGLTGESFHYTLLIQQHGPSRIHCLGP